MKINTATRWSIFGMLVLLAPMTAMARDASTVNSYTPAEEMRAAKAATAAGYAPGKVLFAQAGNFFFNATKDDHHYGLTVVPSGKVYASGPED